MAPAGSQALAPALSVASEGDLEERACLSVAMLHRDRLERHIAHSYRGLSEWVDHPRRRTRILLQAKICIAIS